MPGIALDPDPFLGRIRRPARGFEQPGLLIGNATSSTYTNAAAIR